MRITFVIPVYNELDSIQELYSQISLSANELAGAGRISSWDIWFIDDGSTDGSRDVLRDLAMQHEDVHVASFKHNRGKSAALSAGFALAEGDVVVTMDADLQDDPHELPLLIDKLDEGYDIAVGWKVVRHDPFEKRIASKVYNTVTSALTGIQLHDMNSGYKAYRSEVVKAVNIRDDLHRYIPVLASRFGFTSGEVPVNHRARKYGSSKYGPERYFKGVTGLCHALYLSKFADNPFRFFGTVGLVFAVVGAAALTTSTADTKKSHVLAACGAGLAGAGACCVLYGLSRTDGNTRRNADWMNDAIDEIIR